MALEQVNVNLIKRIQRSAIINMNGVFYYVIRGLKFNRPLVLVGFQADALAALHLMQLELVE